MCVVGKQRTGKRDSVRPLFDPTGHQVDRNVTRPFRIEAVLHLFAISFAEISALHVGRGECSRYASELQREGCGTGLYLFQIEAVLLKHLPIQIDLAFRISENPVRRFVLGAQKTVQDHFELAGVESSSGCTAVLFVDVAAPVVR